MAKLIDDIVICVTVALCLLIGLFLAYSITERGLDYPPTLVTLFLGISVAALTYRFLGGTSGTEFSVGLLKVGGSAALLLGITFLVGNALRSEMDMFENDQGYRDEIDRMRKESAGRLEQINQKEGEISRLTQELAASRSSRVTYNIDQIKKLSPEDEFARSIKRMVDGQEGPFRATIRDIEARVALVAMPGDANLYNIAKTRSVKYMKAVASLTRIFFSRVRLALMATPKAFASIAEVI